MHPRHHGQQLAHAPWFGQGQVHEMLRNVEFFGLVPESEAGTCHQTAVERRGGSGGLPQALGQLQREVRRRIGRRGEQAQGAHVQRLLALFHEQEGVINKGQGLHYRFSPWHADNVLTTALPARCTAKAVPAAACWSARLLRRRAVCGAHCVLN